MQLGQRPFCELGLGVCRDVMLDLLPVPLIIADLATVRAYGEKTAQLPYL